MTFKGDLDFVVPYDITRIEDIPLQSLHIAEDVFLTIQFCYLEGKGVYYTYHLSSIDRNIFHFLTVLFHIRNVEYYRRI